jgi:hypothetical protein
LLLIGWRLAVDQDFAHNIPFFVVLGGYLLIFFVEKIAFDTHGFIEEHHHHPHHGDKNHNHNGVQTKGTTSPTPALNSGTLHLMMWPLCMDKAIVDRMAAWVALFLGRSLGRGVAAGARCALDLRDHGARTG